MHSHLPLLIFAMNGLAGRPLLPIIGQFAMHGLLVNASGSVRSLNATNPIVTSRRDKRTEPSAEHTQRQSECLSVRTMCA